MSPPFLAGLILWQLVLRMFTPIYIIFLDTFCPLFMYFTRFLIQWYFKVDELSHRTVFFTQFCTDCSCHGAPNLCSIPARKSSGRCPCRSCNTYCPQEVQPMHRAVAFLFSKMQILHKSSVIIPKKTTWATPSCWAKILPKTSLWWLRAALSIVTCPLWVYCPDKREQTAGH